jgi:hypothetical protein
MKAPERRAARPFAIARLADEHRGLKCGTPLTYWHEGWPNEISVTISSLDAPADAQPTDHTWMSEAISWDKPADGLREYQTDRWED